MLFRGFPGPAQAMKVDFARIASLGEIFLVKYESSIRSQTESPTADAQLNCLLHQLFVEQFSVPRLNRLDCFLFLSVFCPLFVASMCSQDPDIRRKAQDAASKLCQCEKGWDPTLTIHIARLLYPHADITLWNGYGLYTSGVDIGCSHSGVIMSPETST